MSIVAAKCPVCGRDIGFEEGAEEYTCIFCGSKLILSALKTEHIEAGPAPKPAKVTAKPPVKDEAPAQEKPRAPIPEIPRFESERTSEPELTEEEIKAELERKVGFKEELRAVVKEIDELRAKRDPLKARLKTVKSVSWMGGALLVFDILAVLLLYKEENANNYSNYVLAGGVFVGLIAGFMFFYSAARKRGILKAQKKLEDSISDKKQKRDVLIGRLNKINRRLHIHSDEE